MRCTHKAVCSHCGSLVISGGYPASSAASRQIPPKPPFFFFAKNTGGEGAKTNPKRSWFRGWGWGVGWGKNP